MRYGELHRSIRGVTHKMLTQQLRDLESDGVVIRKDFKEIPPRVEYSLSAYGKGLAKSLQPLCEWGTRNEATIQAALTKREKL